jgi:hypothetical protein
MRLMRLSHRIAPLFIPATQLYADRYGFEGLSADVHGARAMATPVWGYLALRNSCASAPGQKGMVTFAGAQTKFVAPMQGVVDTSVMDSCWPTSLLVVENSIASHTSTQTGMNTKTANLGGNVLGFERLTTRGHSMAETTQRPILRQRREQLSLQAVTCRAR